MKTYSFYTSRYHPYTCYLCNKYRKQITEKSEHVCGVSFSDHIGKTCIKNQQHQLWNKHSQCLMLTKHLECERIAKLENVR